MAHNLVRAAILPDIINKIEMEYHVDENRALDMFYKSDIGKLFSNDDAGLYGQSPNYIFSLFKESVMMDS